MTRTTALCVFVATHFACADRPREVRSQATQARQLQTPAPTPSPESWTLQDTGAVIRVASGITREGPTTLPLYHLRLALPTRSDTIPGVLTPWLPVLADSIVLGFAFDTLAGGLYSYTYNLGTTVLIRGPAPPDLFPSLTDVAISPNGHHVAYVGFPGDCTGVGIVRAWPAGGGIAHTPAVNVGCGDAFTGIAAWSDSTSFEIMMYLDQALTPAGSLPLARFRGSLGGPLVADTISPPPR